MPRTAAVFRGVPLAVPGYTMVRDVEYSPGVSVDISKPNTPNRTALIVSHGGSWDSGDKSEPHYALMAARFAELGFAVFNQNYTLVGAPGYTSQTPIDETLALVQWIRDNAATYNVDATRVAINGVSAGGHLAYMAGATGVPGATRPDAAIGWSPGTDLPDLLGYPALVTVMEAYMGNTYIGNEAEWEAKSPRRIITSACCPLRIVGSDNEDTVGHDHLPVAQFDDMHTAALAAGVLSTKRIFVGRVHGLFFDPPLSIDDGLYQGADDVMETARWLQDTLGSIPSVSGRTVSVNRSASVNRVTAA